MRFWFTEEQNKFRQEVQDFLQAEIQAKTFVAKSGGLAEGNNQEFSRKMSRKGWIGMTWPKEYGGQGRTYVDKVILNEEIFKVQAPVAYHFLADRQIGPSIIHFGSDWQKEYFLPRFVKAEDNMRFCLLFSEPNAGLDFVSEAEAFLFITIDALAPPSHDVLLAEHIRPNVLGLEHLFAPLTIRRAGFLYHRMQIATGTAHDEF